MGNIGRSGQCWCSTYNIPVHRRVGRHLVRACTRDGGHIPFPRCPLLLLKYLSPRYNARGLNPLVSSIYRCTVQRKGTPVLSCQNMCIQYHAIPWTQHLKTWEIRPHCVENLGAATMACSGNTKLRPPQGAAGFSWLWAHRIPIATLCDSFPGLRC